MAAGRGATSWPEARAAAAGMVAAAGLPAACVLGADASGRGRLLVPAALGALVAALGAVGVATGGARLLGVFALDAVALSVGWACFFFVAVRDARPDVASAGRAVALGASAAAWLAAAQLARLLRARLLGGALVARRRGRRDEMALL